MPDEKKIPSEAVPKTPLYLPLAFWSKIMLTLDRKIHSMADIYGFGSVSLQIVVRGGAVKDIVFSDEVRVREKTNIPPEENQDLTR